MQSQNADAIENETIVLRAIETGPALGDYADDDGTISAGNGVSSAIDDWRSGDIEISLLLEVINHWRSGEPVDETGGSGDYAWEGVSPAAIENETNPTLPLTAGNEYTVEWTNETDAEQNFVVEDANGNELLASDSLAAGASQTVDVTATAEMAAYYSATAADQMRGAIEVTQPGEVKWNRDLEVPINADEATDWDNYEVTNVLPTGTLASEYDLQDGEEGEWMQMDVDPEGRIWIITRGKGFVSHGDGYAEVAWVDPDSGEHQLALEIPVIFSGQTVADSGESSTARELGGQGIAIDPDFEENGYVYVMYHPSSDDLEQVDNPYDDNIFYANMLVSRFEMQDDGTLDPDSEQVVFEVPEQFHTCCHHGAYITFGEGREFYISTGDNSNNVGNPDGEVNWFMGDERQGMVHGRPGPVADAQRTSGNTADKRGKIHRIILNEDGSYDIPEGNLKEHWENETGETYSDDEFLPEIYVMGLRNPFTISYDDHTGYLWTAHYGNDANAITELGMPGFGDYHLWCEPGNAGYPYFRAYYPYRDYDFSTKDGTEDWTGEVGQPFWPDNLRNESVNNTGIENIPNVTPALLWHPQTYSDYESATEIHPWLDQPRPGEVSWPELEPGGSADVGSVYRYSEDYGQNALPPYFDGKPFLMRPSNNDNIYYITFDDDGGLELDEFLPDKGPSTAYDMKVLPDGRLAIMDMYAGVHIVEYTGPAPEFQPPPEEAWPERVEPGAEGLSGDPPGDATALWNGEDATLDGWEGTDGSEAEWTEHDDYFEVNLGSGSIRTKEELGDVHLHLEWRVPEEYDGYVDIEEGGDGQTPGNSGVFLMETYEIQIVQSHDNPTYPSGYAGSFYLASEEGGAVPLAMPINPPGEWNTYDIVWRGPRFDENNELLRYPQLTLFFNGVAVINHFDIPGPNWWVDLFADDFDNDTNPHPMDEDGNFLEEAPLQLQDHGAETDEVHFRNIWYRDLPEWPVEVDDPLDLPEYESTRGVWEVRDEYPDRASATDPDHPDHPEQIEPGADPGDAPEDADVLIDDPITIEPGDGDWESEDAYGDAQIHVEYRIPEGTDGQGPWVGDSGVVMMGDYEINIMNAWENPVEAEDWAGAYTHQAGPHHDSVRQPGEWQQLDIVWQAPRFADGELDKPAQVTAFLNGVAVQTRLIVDGSNDGVAINPYNEHGKLPLQLNEEGSEVEFRNTWIREEEADLVSEEPAEPDPLSAPIGLDLGGTHTEETVTVDGLEFLPTPEQSAEIGNEENRTLEDDEKYWPEQVTIEPNPNESPGATSEDRQLNQTQGLGTEPDIANTEHDSLYWTEQWADGELNYAFNIENGTYEVTLHFAEVWFDEEGERVFSGSVNGETLFEGLDLYADHGPDTAVTFSHVVEVEDNELTVSLESSVENPKISGIEIREVNKVAHYDASTLELSDGDAVSTWSDVEGIGPDLTQSDSAAQPTFKTDVANGNPTVRFEGDSDFINAGEVVTDDTAGVTMVAAFRSTDLSVQRQTVLFNGSDGDLNGYGMFVNDEEGAGPPSDGSVHALYGGVNWWYGDSTVAQDQFHVVTLTIPEDAPDQPVLRLDGQEVATEIQTSAAAPNEPTGQFGIGYDDGAIDQRPPYFAGDIGEVRVYNRELSAVERAQLESNLGEKWDADVAEPDLSTGLAGHWTFEAGNVDGDTVTDKSGNGHDGTIVGGVTTDLSAPVPGGAAEFNGDDGTVVVSDADGLDPAAYTVSAWIQTDATGAWAAILGKSESMWCGFEGDTGHPRLDPYDSAASEDYFSTSTDVTDGGWHHIVYRHAPSEGTSSIYIDGQLAASNDGARESPDSDTDLGIGSKSNNADWISGALADVRLYNRPLAESEIGALYQNGGEEDETETGAIEPGTQIEFDGQTGGWVGIAPSGIEGETNPTLTLQEGETYQIGWTTGDGNPHNIAIHDENGEVVDDLSTETTTDPGDGQWLEFTASSEMASYICEVHPDGMIGDIQVE